MIFDHRAVERAARFSDVKAKANRADPIASAASAPADVLRAIPNHTGIAGRSIA